MSEPLSEDQVWKGIRNLKRAKLEKVAFTAIVRAETLQKQLNELVEDLEKEHEARSV